MAVAMTQVTSMALNGFWRALSTFPLSHPQPRTKMSAFALFHGHCPFLLVMQAKMSPPEEAEQGEKRWTLVEIH